MLSRMMLDEHRARLILNAAHAAWSNGDIEGVLNQYVDDLMYWSNTGAPDGGPLIIVGKDGLREMLNSIVAVAESVSVAEYFRFIDGVGRANIECYIRHKTTGHTMVGSYGRSSPTAATASRARTSSMTRLAWLPSGA
jgi:hypothetical protein